ncbi:EI24 domain-containing protein [Candidatus Symbiobacter mobilis]|uniref:Transmembrane protein n=1 Tax=Candidatus Symbiobacter mobilis CR TaxID=946483 RepID=U5N9Z1_9BURK|nr:EI24 domain-containing protein [Candidatus Symbiobacter mobilis]AGX87009.1 hypothetical protein Cenrod_0906 [Candidatus Symbiobacter mobilis CR]
MSRLFDSFWRALLCSMQPRVLFLSLVPLALMLLLAVGFFTLYWDFALDLASEALTASAWVQSVSEWLQQHGLVSLVSVVAPLLVMFAASIVVLVLALLLVALLMTSSLTDFVAARRFPHLERKKGGSLLQSVCWSIGSTALALLALLLSVPLWLVPPLVLLVPPLIWGWLTYRVMAFDALGIHASREERTELFRRHRLELLSIGLIVGYLGAVPGVLWASGALLATIIVVVPVAIWLYTFVFALSSLWFAHFGLSALEALRQERSGEPAMAVRAAQGAA